MRKVCFVLVDRANYGRLKPVMELAAKTPGIDSYAIASGSIVLPRFKRPIDQVAADGIRVTEELLCSVESSTPLGTAQSIGLAVQQFAGAFERHKPDIVVVIGDRFEALGAAMAAVYLERTLVHVQGGELSGTLDEHARHAITKLAHYHVPATELSRRRLLQMGEQPESILTVGCPSSDLARQVIEEGYERHGKVVCVFHPDTTSLAEDELEMELLLVDLQKYRQAGVLLFWPNIDTGSDGISRAIRRFREQQRPSWLEVITHVEPLEYLRLIAGASLCIGNSSSFVRDAGYFQTPIRLVGDRQRGREINQGWLYGDGRVSPRIVSALTQIPLRRHKEFYEGAWHHPGPRWVQGYPAEKPGPAARNAPLGLDL